ncbi:hypothetical protein LWI29_011790 [Acer saccharum]|uniref:Uncharacterized protein n=1 Tax=Acer saccharum TaxID=4024 RepID=A0AA39VYN9_ACESA|nr:hypothetical protein LWI29_011790 [Acer saccharum]
MIQLLNIILSILADIHGVSRFVFQNGVGTSSKLSAKVKTTSASPRNGGRESGSLLRTEKERKEEKKRERKGKRETVVAVVAEPAALLAVGAVGAVALACRRCRSQLSTPSSATVRHRCYCPHSSKPLHLLVDVVAVFSCRDGEEVRHDGEGSNDAEQQRRRTVASPFSLYSDDEELRHDGEDSDRE